MKNVREGLALAGLVATWLIVATHYWALPQTVPTHFNANGVVDGWGGKWDLWFAPGFACVLYAVLTLVRFLPERMINVPVSAAQRAAAVPMCMEMTGWAKAETMWMSAGIAWMMVASAQGNGSMLMLLIPAVSVAVLLGTIGFYLWRMMSLPG